MLGPAAILNEREDKQAQTSASGLERALSSDEYFGPVVSGLPPVVVQSYRRALETQLRDLRDAIEAYANAKAGEPNVDDPRFNRDPGYVLVLARIVRGLSQKGLARLLGLREQQVQRYEADRYRSISISNYARVARILGVKLSATLYTKDAWTRSGSALPLDVSSDDIKKAVKHAKEHKWFETQPSPQSPEESFGYLQRYISEHTSSFGSPARLRTGLNVEDLSKDFLLLAWKARVTRLAEAVIDRHKPAFNGPDISWLSHLVRLSARPDGPLLAQQLLLAHGIVLVVEPQIAGLKLDGAAFLAHGCPIIGLTLRRDAIDNFWFSLLHEVGHVLLHSPLDLQSGYFDDSDLEAVDEIEHEADSFASNLLIPDEKWRRSPARISTSQKVIERFAADNGIHPAIVFGRIRRERRAYSTFSNLIGAGTVRQFFAQERAGQDAP